MLPSDRCSLIPRRVLRCVVVAAAFGWFGVMPTAFGQGLARSEVTDMISQTLGDGDSVGAPKIERYPLWEGAPPDETQAPVVAGIRYFDIKKREPEVDGFDWLHGVALQFHDGVLFASWGNNRGLENTPTEVTRGSRSLDKGQTWTSAEMIEPGGQGLGSSHGAFLSHEGKLWLFVPRFGKGTGQFPGLRMEALCLDEETGTWGNLGTVAQGVWPLQTPVRMTDGNWIVAGCDENWRGVVAISHGDDLLRWDTVRLPVAGRVYTEATVWVEGTEVTAVMRNESPLEQGFIGAAVTLSHDGGRTWSPPRESNFPLATSKPCAGRLSTGQRYLLANVCVAQPRSRRTLAIAVSRPGEKALCRLYRIETVDGALAYPYAAEADGYLYVGYSRAPRGLGGNRNDARLAVLPVASLSAEP